MPGGAALTGPTGHVGRANNVPPGGICPVALRLPGLQGRQDRFKEQTCFTDSGR